MCPAFWLFFRLLVGWFFGFFFFNLFYFEPALATEAIGVKILLIHMGIWVYGSVFWVAGVLASNSSRGG